MFWEEKFTGEENFTLGQFIAANMKNCVCHNVRKLREIKDSYEYITLDISLEFDSLDKMRIIYSDPKDNYVISGKGLIISLGIKAKASPNKYKKCKLCHWKCQYEVPFKYYQGFLKYSL